MQELQNNELQEIDGGAITAAAVGCALLGIGSGVVIGAAVAIGVCYVVRKMNE